MFLLDTNVISELRKLGDGMARPTCVSLHGSRAAWMDRHVLPEFVERTLPVDSAVALKWARLHVPDPRAERDALIAATAIVHGMTVVTRNVADFETTGAVVVDPWAGAYAGRACHNLNVATDSGHMASLHGPHCRSRRAM